MCGITGYYKTNTREIAPSVIRKMTDVLEHRGPDDSGVYLKGPIALGHRRLSIIDLVTGHQPMCDISGNIWIVFNGEIYNFLELKAELEKKKYTFRTHSDTEVILNSYREWGIDCVKKFNGMFSFALWDNSLKTIFLVRDRLGIKPLYYTLQKGNLVFASEVKSILQFPGVEYEVNLNAISSYLTFRTNVGDESFFKNISKLSPGHILTYNGRETKVNKYWEIPYFKEKEDKGIEYYLEKSEELLKKAVKMRLMSDVPLGAYLSGGLDSSIIVGFMSKLKQEPTKTYSIGFAEKGYNEFNYSRLVRDFYKTDHKEIVLNQDKYLELLPMLIRQKDAPLSIPHETALYQMSKELKKDITVVMSGEGADELFGGYGRVQRSPMDFKKIMFFKKFPSPIKTLLYNFARENGVSNDEIEKIDTRMDHFFSVYNWMPFEEKWNIFTDDVKRRINLDRPLIDYFETLFDNTKEIDPYDSVLYIFEKVHLPNLLERLDMMSMAASVEARVPFVDHELVEFVSSIPVKYKLAWKSIFHKMIAAFIPSGTASEKLDTTKVLLRKIGSKLLPPDIVNRKKLGFPVPLDKWKKEGMGKFAHEILLDGSVKRRGYFNQENVEKLMSSKQNLKYDFYGKKIWMLVNIELWLREYFS